MLNNEYDDNRVIVNPDGTSSYLKKSNPYIADTDALIPNREIRLPQAFLEKAVKLDRMNCPVRAICLCDIFMTLYYTLFGYIYGVFGFMFSTCGFISTIYYRKYLMCCYVIYQYLQVVGRLMIVFIIYDKDIVNSNNTQVVRADVDYTNYALAIVLLLMQICIAMFINKYYNLLPTETEKYHIRNNL